MLTIGRDLPIKMFIALEIRPLLKALLIFFISKQDKLLLSFNTAGRMSGIVGKFNGIIKPSNSDIGVHDVRQFKSRIRIDSLL